MKNERALKALGRIAVNHAILEKRAGMLAGGLITDRFELGRIVTAELSFRALLALISSLGKFHWPDVDSAPRRELNNWVNEVNRANDERNRWTHSAWGTTEGEDESKIVAWKDTAKQGKGLRMKIEVVHVGTLEELATRLATLADEKLQSLVHILAPTCATLLPGMAIAPVNHIKAPLPR